MLKIDTIRTMVNDFGIHYPKKHGEWVKFCFEHEDTFFMLDTWSGDLNYCKGGGEYEYWLGFYSVPIWRFGTIEAWGGYNPEITQNVIDYYINKVSMEIVNRTITRLTEKPHGMSKYSPYYDQESEDIYDDDLEDRCTGSVEDDR